MSLLPFHAGLRFSHFKEEIAFHSDPGQKTLTAFLKPAPELASPGRSSGPETAPKDGEKAPGGATGLDNRGPDSAKQPSASASPSSPLEPGPSAQQRIADAHLKAALATASFVNERRRRGGDESAGGEGEGREQGKGKRDGKIDRLLGRMRRGEDNVEEVGCATCTFLNRAGSRMCRMCGAQLDGKNEVAMAFRMAVSTEEGKSADLDRSGIPVMSPDSALLEPLPERGALPTNGNDCDTAERQSGLEEASDVGISQPGSCGESVEVDPSLRQWVGEYDRAQSRHESQRSEQKEKVQFEDWVDDDRAGKEFGQIHESLPGGEESVWTDPDVQMGLDSDEDFDVVGSFRDWSEADVRPPNLDEGKWGEGQDRVDSDTELLKIEEWGRGVVGVFGRGLSEGGEDRRQNGAGCDRLLKREASTEKASPGKRPRLAETIPISATDTDNQIGGSGSVPFDRIDSRKNGSSGNDGGTADCDGVPWEGVSVGAPSVGRPDSTEPGETSPTASRLVHRDRRPEALADSKSAPRELFSIREDSDTRSVPVSTGRAPEHLIAGAKPESPEEASGPTCKPGPEPGAKLEEPGDVTRPGVENSLQAEVVKCESCGELVPGSGQQRQEHEDYHVALALHKLEGARLQPVARSSGSQQHAGKKR